MSIEFRYIEELGCLHTIGRGKVLLEDFLNYHRTVDIANPPDQLLILSDYREVDPSELSSSDIEQIRTNTSARTDHKYRSVKEAIVVSETLAYGLSRMYDGVAYSEKYDINVFTDINEAKVWLGLEADTFSKNRNDLPGMQTGQMP
jgi:hypothetical protein